MCQRMEKAGKAVWKEDLQGNWRVSGGLAGDRRWTGHVYRGTVGPPSVCFIGSYTLDLGREMCLGFLCVKVVEIMSLLAIWPGA